MNDGDSIIFCAHSMALTEQNGWGSHLLIPSPPVEVSVKGNRDAVFLTKLCLPRVREDHFYLLSPGILSSTTIFMQAEYVISSHISL